MRVAWASGIHPGSDPPSERLAFRRLYYDDEVGDSLGEAEADLLAALEQELEHARAPALCARRSERAGAGLRQMSKSSSPSASGSVGSQYWMYDRVTSTATLDAAIHRRKKR